MLKFFEKAKICHKTVYQNFAFRRGNRKIAFEI